MPSDELADGKKKDRTTHKPLHCRECKSRIVLTVREQDDSHQFECECTTRRYDEDWPDDWVTSVAREVF